MNHYLLSLLLGVIEGVTEFLPVSSTAHLRIAEALLGIDLSNGYWKMFSIVIQFGAILCLPLYFRRRLGEFLATFPRGIRGDRTPLNHPLTLTALAFVCTAVPAFALTKLIGKNLENLVLMASCLIGPWPGIIYPLFYHKRPGRTSRPIFLKILYLAGSVPEKALPYLSRS